MPKSKWKNQFVLIESSSNFHKAVRDVFTSSSFFSSLRCYQEVPLGDLCPSFSNRNLFVDWYIHELNTALELHGKQHYDIVNFGNTSYKEAERNFIEGQYRDSLKQAALEEEGIFFKVIPYTIKGKINESFLKTLLLG